ncbi:hypothetical protein I312_103640 [Cryptococcus bacillisporus CA1280]|uniref:uncharacterized protein n=1 Tax=Cryptococcus bacillisporus CA1280 TaxID=1296109 RepID=UPI0033692F1E
MGFFGAFQGALHQHLGARSGRDLFSKANTTEHIRRHSGLIPKDNFTPRQRTRSQHSEFKKKARGTRWLQYREESVLTEYDAREKNNRGMFYCSVAVCEISTYQTSWVSSPELPAFKLQYLPVYKV